MILNAAELTALASDVVNIGVFFRLETNPVVRLWLGFGDIEPGVNAYDVTGELYTGFGEIVDVPTFKQLLNGKAERVEFSLSGVSGDVFMIASGNDAGQVKGKPARVGFAVMAEDWSLLGPVHWLANYTADYLSLQQSPVNDPKNPVVRTITLSCGTRFTGRRRPAFSYFTDQDQQARSPGDIFFHVVGKYAHGFNMDWPLY